MWRMSSCLRCCPRQKLRMTEDFTIPSLQRSSLLSNIQKTLGSSFQYFFICCFLLKYHLRTIEGIRAGTLAVTAQLLPTFLFPDDHVYDPNDISHNVLRGHIMIRVTVMHICLPVILVTVFFRSQSICFKALQQLLSNLVLTVENREMHRYAAWHRWLLTRLHTLPYRYAHNDITVFFRRHLIYMTLNRHALLWVRQVHGPTSMGRSAIQISTGE